MLPSFLLILFACDRPDYNLIDPSRNNLGADENSADTTGTNDGTDSDGSTNSASDPDINEIHEDDIKPFMRLDAAIQHMGWGLQQTRCQIEVAFNRRHFLPPENEDDEENSPPPPPEHPDEPGECIFTSFERPQSQNQGPGTGPGTGQGSGQNPGQGQGGQGQGQGGSGQGQGPGEPQDDWFISGDISGPEAVYLHSLEQTITLNKVVAEDGLIRYEMANCNQYTFPFGETFDIEIPESTGDDAVPPAYIHEVLTFGPDISIETPGGLHMMEQYQGYASDGLFFSWSFAEPVSNLIEERLSVRLTNNSNQPWDFEEGMECMPENREELMLWDTDLLQFTLSDYLGQGIFSIGLNIHGDYYGPEREDPWGNIFKARVNITRGGMMELAE